MVIRGCGHRKGCGKKIAALCVEKIFCPSFYFQNVGRYVDAIRVGAVRGQESKEYLNESEGMGLWEGIISSELRSFIFCILLVVSCTWVKVSSWVLYVRE
ncbi:hypothetical protein XELAEV_18000024mg [Xenopus laevis]|uniref:Uncharacterized protein n=1 Tax=Xenopus laevis TaxID=8355 RepID=A0A974GYW8_XENLA|nr:hypothetical protein XELAEV_18000024mg [Xenopus laevis]